MSLPAPNPVIILTALNARYFHGALGLRYLLANMGDLKPSTRLVEFTIDQRPLDIVENLLTHSPRIIGFGVYIWNVAETTQVVALLKQLRPDILIVLGGPEVSHETGVQAIVQWADHVLTGPADLAFAELCRRILNGDPPPGKIIAAEPPRLDAIASPYGLYTDADIAHRLIYVEASRGCPFTCEFCLSALDKTAKPFPLERFLADMDALYRRGVRHFKFVDRSFNLNGPTGAWILEFFLERLDERLFLHFELIPDRLPERLKALIAKFPPGSLQFEIGVQTFNPSVQALISRRQDDAKTVTNLRWLREATHAHLHTDLIVGLPGEDVASFAAGFDRLIALDPHEIQVGILKRLRGAPIDRHTIAYGMKYNPQPPYNLLCSDLIDFATMQRLNRFARYWDLIGNSGRFRHTRPCLLGDAPFARLLRCGDWLFAETGRTHQIALDRLFDLLHRCLVEELGVAADHARAQLTLDYQAYQAAGGKGSPRFLADHPPAARQSPRRPAAPTRQSRHIA